MRRNSRYAALVIAGLVVLCAAPAARAQNGGTCSPEEVQNALDQLDCIADGIYLSPETAARAVGNLCSQSLTKRSCRRCFLKSGKRLFPAFRTLIDLDMLDPQQLRNLRSVLYIEMQAVCEAIGSPSPTPTPPANQTPAPPETALPTPPVDETPPPVESPVPTPEPEPSLTPTPEADTPTPEPTATAIETPFNEPPAYPTYPGPSKTWRDWYRYPSRWH